MRKALWRKSNENQETPQSSDTRAHGAAHQRGCAALGIEAEGGMSDQTKKPWRVFRDDGGRLIIQTSVALPSETLRTTISIDVEVSFNYSPKSYGSRERGTGLALEPDEPESIEITRIGLTDSVTLNISQFGTATQKQLEAECFEHVAQKITESKL